MMLMAKNMKNAGTTQDDPPISKRDNLYKEVCGEHNQAMIICRSILSALDLTWDKIEDELNMRHVNGWEEPGDIVDLRFLQSSEHGAI
jgi:hypothetical protein